jgi:lipopolysaccharide/colanic/teichoic acid biosynthesis glycosyltransferase
VTATVVRPATLRATGRPVVRRPLLAAVLVAAERTTAAVALVLLSPLLLAVALAVRLSSPGPAIYRQVRVGRYGRHFTILKFRTMRTGADAELERLVRAEQGEIRAYVKLRSDPRLTRLGPFLRMTSLDELPQLWNVLRGDMSLVGPRPQTPAEVATYSVDEWRRLLTRPGITGLWQVSGRSDLAPEEALGLDIRYVREWSPWLDLRVLVRTVAVIWRREGAC